MKLDHMKECFWHCNFENYFRAFFSFRKGSMLSKIICKVLGIVRESKVEMLALNYAFS